jgi:FkbM family methyltransferase
MLGYIRDVLGSFGYVLSKRDFLKYGINPCLDVRRLSKARGHSVELIFDVGAFHGEMRQELRAEFPNAEIHSFEPHPNTFAKLKMIPLGRGEVHQIALSDKNTTLPLHAYGDTGSGSPMDSLTPNAGFALRHNYDLKTINVDCMTADYFCEMKGIEKIDLFKIDVEGHDLNVIKGAQRMLESGSIRFIYVEFNDLWDRDGIEGGSLLPIALFLKTYGYRFVATYTDRIEALPPLFVSSNAMFVLDKLEQGRV